MTSTRIFRGENEAVIPESDIEKAIDWLRDTAEACAKKRAERLYLEDFSRSLKAQIMSEHLAEPLGAQERHAFSDIRYRNHIEALKLAIYEDEKGRFLRDAAEAKIRAWQTQQATERGKL